jgi:3-deoxy-7-phosphoheptulonate synthase
MIVVMSPEATGAEVQELTDRIAEVGLRSQTLPGEQRLVIALIGDTAGHAVETFAELAGVDRVMRVQRPYKLASIEAGVHEPSVFAIGGRVVGPETFCLIAGPCTVESREQTLRVADAVRVAGGSMLRGGAFKPRTSPFAFQGLGEEALDILAEARDRTGLPVVSELIDPRLADLFPGRVDVVQIGTRNMQNYPLLREAGALGLPVVLKRGLAASLDELLQAADYILEQGNAQVLLCERGIRSFDDATRFVLDLGAVPALKLRTHLPVIVDPSHATGDRRLVSALAKAAAAVGADGLLVEVHDDPAHALCDGPQQLATADFPAFIQAVAAHAALEGRTLA